MGPAVAAWLVPGLGHWLLGERRRAVVLVAAIGVLWLAGLLIGGIGVIDRHQNFAWFIGQSFIAPSIAVDYVRAEKMTRRDLFPTRAGQAWGRYEPSFGRVHEQGVLYTALAGMLNLLAVLDVVYRDPRRTRWRHPQPPEGAPLSEASPDEAWLHPAHIVVPLVLLAGMVGITALMGYTPFLDPLTLDRHWLLLLPPLVLAVALVYKTIKLDDLGRLAHQTTVLAGQIFAFMVLAAAGLWLLTELV